ncbi:hypothetical protein [Nocardia sp. alder85J]|uniref:hypothetical protein n=1 Tax=Nocardia sp. alder85J TaxID=2862949 RepID=UPI001CD7C603|nr:hypothetical protein [Nocardia sp. alder85J]MCX4092616.1 hypothetical protein [Nocardia sp. alder85J]
MNQRLYQPGPSESNSGVEGFDDCGTEPGNLTFRRARNILHAHDRHLGCRQWIAAAAYLSAGLDDE